MKVQMKKTVVINVVGLSQGLIGDNTPFIRSFMEKGKAAVITPVLPAVTCSAQATYLTGKLPTQHGIVANGWYFKEECEVKFWRQSNRLVQSEKIWDKLKSIDSNFTCANLFWWYNMYSSVDYSVTPRPNYLADGRKIPDVYSSPANLRDTLQSKLGSFPLFHFWGPKTSIRSSQWIADAAILTDELYDPKLTLVYLPHLDYNLQRYGKNHPKVNADLIEIDQLVNQLISYYNKPDCNIILLSEYGITNVQRPIHPNRILREKGYLNIRTERGLELLDAGASDAFAVSDHQLAHIYLNDKSLKPMLIKLFEGVDGIESVLTGEAIAEAGLAHTRSGDIVIVADQDSWFTYYYWQDDSKAPDFARTVDIHKKPGYDPVEMMTQANTATVIGKLLKKKLGFRTLMDIIPLDASLIRGSHGRIPENPDDKPIFITNQQELLAHSKIDAVDVFSLIEQHVLQPDR